MTALSARKNKRSRGLSLVDALVGLMILSIGALSITALLPGFSRSQYMADEMSKAAQIASRQIEQLRTVGYNSLNYPTLRSLGLVDEWNGEGPMTFSVVAHDHALGLSASATLPQGVGEVVINQGADGLREVIVRVRWVSRSGADRNVELATLVGADWS